MLPHPGCRSAGRWGPPRCCPRLLQLCPQAGVAGPWCCRRCCGAAPGKGGGCSQPSARIPTASTCPGRGNHDTGLSSGTTAMSTPGDTFGSCCQLAWGDGCWRDTVPRWSYQQDVTPPKPVRHRWAPARNGCGSASTICSGTSSDGGSHGGPCPASSRGDNDPHPANPPTPPWHGGLRALPPVAAVPACRCQLPRRRRPSPSPACSAGTAPAPRTPGSPSPGDGTDIPPRRQPRAHRAAGASAPRSLRAIPGGFGAAGGIRDTPAMPAAWRPGTPPAAPGSPRVPQPCRRPGSVGGPGDPSLAGGDGGGSPRARAPSQRPPPALGSPWAQPRHGLV